MTVVYIAGPFRGPDAYAIHQHICRAEALALKVWRLGAAAICPHLNTAHFQGALPDQVWLEGDLAILRRCDVVLTLPDWTRSAGARAEVRAAREWAIPVLADLAELGLWLHEARTAA